MTSSDRPAGGNLELRRQLLDHARRLLEEGGPESISVRVLGDLTTRSRQVVYTVFGDRQALMAALAVSLHVELADRLVAWPTSRNPLVDLFAQCEAYLAWTREHPRAYQFMTAVDLDLGTRADDRVRLSYGPVSAAQHEVVQRVLDTGSLHCPNTLYLSSQLGAALHGGALHELELQARGQDDASGDTGLELVSNLLIALGSPKTATRRALLRAQSAAR